MEQYVISKIRKLFLAPTVHVWIDQEEFLPMSLKPTTHLQCL